MRCRTNESLTSGNFPSLKLLSKIKFIFSIKSVFNCFHEFYDGILFSVINFSEFCSK